jgi:hypothetical protein
MASGREATIVTAATASAPNKRRILDIADVLLC